MGNLPFILIALACPVGMGLMMLLMGRGMMGMGKRRNHDEPADDASPEMPADPDKRLAILQAQRQLLDAQIGALGEEATTTASDPRFTTRR